VGQNDDNGYGDNEYDDDDDAHSDNDSDYTDTDYSHDDSNHNMYDNEDDDNNGEHDNECEYYVSCRELIWTHILELKMGRNVSEKNGPSCSFWLRRH